MHTPDVVTLVDVTHGVGELLRRWRLRRRFSQLQLASEANISTRHLSFLESGRSKPSREMILLLSENLKVPLRARNLLLQAAGYSALYSARAFDDIGLQNPRRIVERILSAHEPFPSLAVDRHWNIVVANRAATSMMVGVDATLLIPPVNALRLSLHPKGLATRIVNYHQWRTHLLERLRSQIDASADVSLEELHAELESYVAPDSTDQETPVLDLSPVAVPLKLRVGDAVYSFISTTTVFGTPFDITLSELAVETFFPADATSYAALTAADNTPKS